MENGKYIVAEKPVYYPSFPKPSEYNYSQDVIKDIPCWSLSALLNVLPKTVRLVGDPKNRIGIVKLWMLMINGMQAGKVQITPLMLVTI